MKLQLMVDIAEAKSGNKIPFHDTDSQEAVRKRAQRIKNETLGSAGRILLSENK